MNVLIIVPEMKQCGPLNVVRDMLFSGLFKMHKIIIVELRSSKDFEYKASFKNFVDDIYSLNGNSFKSFIDFLLIVKKFKPDVCHSHGFFPDIFNSLNFSCRKITTVHNVTYRDYYNFYGYKGFIFSFVHYLFIFIFIKRIVGCSNVVKKHLKKVFLNIKNVECINNGIDTKKFCEKDFEWKLKERKNNNLENYQEIFVYSGGLVRVKRVPELIDIFVSQKNKNSLLIILGDGVELEKCVDKAKDFDNIRILGRVKNPEYYYQISDYIISNSSSEGYPLAILEAISCGCYAYLSEIPAHKEIYTNLKGSVEFISNINQSDFKKINKELISSYKMAKQYLVVYSKK